MSITASIFLGTDSGLVELGESAYDSEAIVQQLLADYPRLIPGDQIDADTPRRLLLIRREDATASSGRAPQTPCCKLLGAAANHCESTAQQGRVR